MELADFLPYLSDILGGIIGGAFTYLVARHNNKAEIQKLAKEFERQQQVADDQQFAEMIRLADEQMGSASIDSRAIAAICSARSKVSGEYAEALDELYFAVASTERVRIPAAIEKVVAARAASKSK